MKFFINLILNLLASRTCKPEPEFWLSEDGAWLMGLDIIHVDADADRPFGITATRDQKPFSNIVAHDPVVHKAWTIFDTIKLINEPRDDGYYYGYIFLIDVDGTIYQCAPLTKRTNHVKSKRNRTGIARHVNNQNAIGISFQHADKNPGRAPKMEQMYAGLLLRHALEQVFERTLPVYGHGQLQTDRDPDEGLAFVKACLTKSPSP